MTAETAMRITRARDLGRRGRGLDVALGLAAIVPIVILDWAAAQAQGEALAAVRAAATIWGGCLLAFLAGVRRGLIFSEAGGARAGEIASFLGVFAVALVMLLFRSPTLGALGLAVVGVLDRVAARRGQAPRSFRLLRPLQMGVGALGLLFIGLRTGA